MSLGPGTRLDAYEIVRPLGKGGMGEVWLATEVRLGRKVALKILPAELTGDPIRVQRFEQEARAASALNHPNVCHIYALGETPDGQHYIAMELVEGDTLRQRLSTVRLAIREALDIAIQVAAVLSAAHAAGIVHRDIKPENVMLRPDEFVKVLDFGLAKLTPAALETAGGERTHTVLKTESGTVVGTAAYMSPEQTRGQDVDARTDIWSVGVLLYEMVAGRRPFEEPTGSDVLAAILDRDPAPLVQFEPRTPSELQRIVSKALRKDRERRYQLMKELRLDLESLRDASPQGPHTSGAITKVPTTTLTTTARPVTGSAPAVAPSSHRRTLVRSAAVLGAAMLAWAGGWLWFTHRGQEPFVRPETTVTRLTANPAVLSVGLACISPDGKYVAYSDSTGIQLRVIDTGETQRLADTRGMMVYAWTADGTKVRAARCDQYMCTGWDLSILSTARQPSGATWPANHAMWATPDGSRLMLINEHGDVKVDFLNGEEPKTVAHGADWRGAGWSADGTRVYFARGPGGIESVSTNGSSPSSVFRAETGTEVMNIGPGLRDGRILVVLGKTSATRTGLQKSVSALVEIHAAGPDATRTRVLTAWTTDPIDAMSASSDGSRLTFLWATVQADVYVADFDGAHAVLTTPTRVTLDDRDDYATAWTPDNAQVIFQSNRLGTLDLFKQRWDSDVADPFVIAPGDQQLPRVTSDGQWVLYIDDRPANATRIMRVPLGGGRPEPLVTFPSGTTGWCHCAYYGRCVLIENSNTGGTPSAASAVFSVDPIRGKQHKLAQLPEYGAFGTALTADGEHFAYIMPEEKGIRNRIRTVSLQGNPPQDIVVKNAVQVEGLNAFPTGGFFSVERSTLHPGLLFIQGDGNATIVWRPEQLEVGPAIPSPDGKRLAITAWTHQSNVWLADQR